MDRSDLLTIGDLARGSGVAPSALRYWESVGLITSSRTAGDRPRYRRAVLRRVAVIRAAQRVGLTFDEIASAFTSVPAEAGRQRSKMRPTRRYGLVFKRRRQWETVLQHGAVARIGVIHLVLSSSRT